MSILIFWILEITLNDLLVCFDVGARLQRPHCYGYVLIVALLQLLIWVSFLLLICHVYSSCDS